MSSLSGLNQGNRSLVPAIRDLFLAVMTRNSLIASEPAHPHPRDHYPHNSPAHYLQIDRAHSESYQKLICHTTSLIDSTCMNFKQGGHAPTRQIGKGIFPQFKLVAE